MSDSDTESSTDSEWVPASEITPRKSAPLLATAATPVTAVARSSGTRLRKRRAVPGARAEREIKQEPPDNVGAHTGMTLELKGKHG